jgi:hypothetical protein
MTRRVGHATPQEFIGAEPRVALAECDECGWEKCRCSCVRYSGECDLGGCTRRASLIAVQGWERGTNLSRRRRVRPQPGLRDHHTEPVTDERIPPVTITRRHLSLVPDLAPEPAQEPAAPAPKHVESMDRDEAITRIRAALKRRSTKRWSVRGGRGTSWGWITIIAPPSRRGESDEMADEDCKELGELFGLDRPAHFQGIDVPASSRYRHEYVTRAEGRQPDVLGTPYWD